MNPQLIRQIVHAPAGESEPGTGQGGNPGTIAQGKQTLTSTARETAARIKSAANETAARAKTEAQRLASQTKDETARRLGGYGQAMHDSARSLEEQDPNIAWATHRVADRIQGVADYVRTSDFDQLREDAENFARRHPVAFFGGLLIGGLVIGNLLKARPADRLEDESTDFSADDESGNQILSEPTATGGIQG